MYVNSLCDIRRMLSIPQILQNIYPLSGPVGMLRFNDFNPLLQNKLRICTLDKVDINIQRSLDFLSHKMA